MTQIHETKGIGGHHSAKAGSDDWLTPPSIIRALGPFDLDPCASRYQPWRTAATQYTVNDSGLTKPWRGRVWLNPPYGRETGKWLAKLAEHGDGIALIFARTETEFFHRSIWPKATAIRFLKGRLNFHRPGGERAKTNAGGPSCLVAYGHHNAAAIIDPPGLPGHYINILNERLNNRPYKKRASK